MAPQQGSPVENGAFRDWLLAAPDRDIVKLVDQAADSSSLLTDGLGGRISAFLQEKGIEPPTIKEMMDRFRCNEKTVRDNLALLIRNGTAVRISSDLFYETSALNSLRDKLLTYLKEKGEITPPEYRELTGLSRKFLIPLLEHFDSEKVTIRVGDKRVLRRR